jgi:hypothetical protein
MVFVPAHALDVVPGGGLVARKALLHARLRLARHPGRDHLEMLHVVTRRPTVALGAIRRTRGRMPKCGNRPGPSRVAPGAVASEQRLVPVLVGVTGCAVERRLRRRPAVAAECAPGPVQRAALFGTALPDSGKSGMIHSGRPRVGALVLDVAFAATADRGMKRCWLALQKGLVIGVTDDAVGGLGALDCCVAGCAVVLQERMCSREAAWTGEALPRRGLFEFRLARQQQKRSGSNHKRDRSRPSRDPHANHLRPK